MIESRNESKITALFILLNHQERVEREGKRALSQSLRLQFIRSGLKVKVTVSRT